MVIDTSALLCILLGEPEAEQHACRLVMADSVNVISAVTWFETTRLPTSSSY
ncbi:MAG: type II toxin-antitoxin system VapC family toxin [Candidatus Competibacteraceae bacterium]